MADCCYFTTTILVVVSASSFASVLATAQTRSDATAAGAYPHFTADAAGVWV